MNVALWVVQVLLAVVFVGQNVRHILSPEPIADPMLAWRQDVPHRYLRAIEVLEVLGGLGLILPGLIGVATWLTPLAALGLALAMVGATLFHLRRGEKPNVAITSVLGLLALAVSIGRAFIAPL